MVTSSVPFTGDNNRDAEMSGQGDIVACQPQPVALMVITHHVVHGITILRGITRHELLLSLPCIKSAIPEV